MDEKLISLIARHLTYMKAVEKSSIDIYESAKSEQFQVMVKESKNRARLISIIQDIQNSIECSIEEDEQKVKESGLLDILLKWNSDVAIWVDKVNKIDQQIVDFLQDQKEKTIQEIAHIFKNKQAFNGYNLSKMK
jgi:hypothetical protein